MFFPRHAVKDWWKLRGNSRNGKARKGMEKRKKLLVKKMIYKREGM